MGKVDQESHRLRVAFSISSPRNQRSASKGFGLLAANNQAGCWLSAGFQAPADLEPELRPLTSSLSFAVASGGNGVIMRSLSRCCASLDTHRIASKDVTEPLHARADPGTGKRGENGR
jgi:hypothetical protein